MKSDRSFPGLEICRFFAAIAVMFWHYQHFYFQGPWIPAEKLPEDAFPLYSAFGGFYRDGSVAVYVFWVLSGFIFYWGYGHAISQRQITLFEFGWRRFSRLYPLHFITLALVAVMQIIYFRSHGCYFIYEWNDVRRLILQLGMASHWPPHQPESFNGPIWSVSVEVLIYGLFFFILVRTPPSIIVTILLSSMFATVTLFAEHPALDCAKYFFAGGTIFMLPRKRYPWIFVTIGLIAAGLSIALPIAFTEITDAPALLFAFSTGTVLTLSAVPAAAIPNKLAGLGSYSYSIYLLHFPVQLAMVSICDGIGIPRSSFAGPIALLLYFATTLSIGVLAYHSIEAPAQERLRSLLAVGGRPPDGSR